MTASPQERRGQSVSARDAEEALVSLAMMSAQFAERVNRFPDADHESTRLRWTAEMQRCRGLLLTYADERGSL